MRSGISIFGSVRTGVVRFLGWTASPQATATNAETDSLKHTIALLGGHAHTSLIRRIQNLEFKKIMDETGGSLDSALMRAIDAQVAHVWMVRTFLKHSDEAAEDEELASVHRDLYDFMLALGPSLDAGDAKAYLKLAAKKLSKLTRATELYTEIQPEVSGHMNFCMAARSLELAVAEIRRLVSENV